MLSANYAGVAQLVEQLIRNQEVGGSIPLFGTIFINGLGGVLKNGIWAVLGWRYKLA